MSDHVTPPHLTDHGEHELPDDSQTSGFAKLLFGWTSKPWAGRVVFLVLALVSAGLIAAEVLLEAASGEGHHFRHAYFGIDAITAFYAMWGFFSFTLVVLAGWPLGRLLRRDETYYEDEEEPAGEEPHA
ncbi:MULTISPECIES: hypothetical protein [Henriciella]|uniref:hypothetical protein n=1 Tax=Henriciella TaxID=453849 RepID=UPI0035124727